MQIVQLHSCMFLEGLVRCVPTALHTLLYSRTFACKPVFIKKSCLITLLSLIRKYEKHFPFFLITTDAETMN